MAETITISVKLFAALKKYLPPKSEDGTSLTLPAGSTVRDAVAALNIPPDHAAMLMANDSYVEKETPLTDGLELSIFPPLAGGCADSERSSVVTDTSDAQTLDHPPLVRTLTP